MLKLHATLAVRQQDTVGFDRKASEDFVDWLAVQPIETEKAKRRSRFETTRLQERGDHLQAATPVSIRNAVRAESDDDCIGSGRQAVLDESGVQARHGAAIARAASKHRFATNLKSAFTIIAEALVRYPVQDVAVQSALNDHQSPTILQRFLTWVEAADVQARTGAARSLVAAFDGEQPSSLRGRHLHLMLSALADDRSIEVRRALAEAAARSVDVPRSIVVTIAHDQSAVALPVLQTSPLLTPSDLVDVVSLGDVSAQSAVAGRAALPAAVAMALSEVGEHAAVLALGDNDAADLPDLAIKRMLARFGGSAELREVLLQRRDLDPVVRHALVVETTRALTRFAIACDWMTEARADRLARDCRDKATVTIALSGASRTDSAGVLRLAAHLKTAGQLTPALILRSLLSGSTALLEASLAECSGQPSHRVAGHIRSADGLGFASIYKKAGLPAVLLPVFRAAVRAANHAAEIADPGALDGGIVARVLASCDHQPGGANDQVIGLLHRFQAESMRDTMQASNRRRPDAVRPSEGSRTVQPWMLPAPELRSAA